MTTFEEFNRQWEVAEARRRASDAARLGGERRHWYFVKTDYCPVCGRDDTYRERVYGERPERWEDRHYFSESYDYCDV